MSLPVVAAVFREGTASSLGLRQLLFGKMRPAGEDRRRDLTSIQWFVAIASSYLFLAREGRLHHPGDLALVLTALGTALVFTRLPDAVFRHPYFLNAMVLVDTLLFFAAIVINQQSPWDLCLVFFVGVLIAAIGESLIQTVLGSLALGVASVLLVPLSGRGELAFDAENLLRLPLLFGASVLYGYLAEQAKAESQRAARAEESRRQQIEIKNRFFSHISHELRTPLAAVHQFITILMDGIPGELKREQREYLEIALKNVRQLQGMVGDLLEAARAEDGKIVVEPRPVDLRSVIGDLRAELQPAAAEKSVALSAEVADGLPPVLADPRRVRQILSNLVDNGVKFTPPGGRVAIRARRPHAAADFVQVSVSDTGCGIAPEALNRIFDRLYQEERTAQANRRGLGLGLYICRELVARHGGRIWVESEIGKGSAFHFTLPVVPAQKPAGPGVHPAPADRETEKT
ncbi:MAG TPA: HAMP domain-containing sensor histidine kinase [candidate division Zixibacteria bacterium]|nr:HAMP domain-containing sensor histidine kinase [candidate division Zixibacteria bacterium]